MGCTSIQRNPFLDGHSGAKIRESGAGLWTHSRVISDLIVVSTRVDVDKRVNEKDDRFLFDGKELISS